MPDLSLAFQAAFLIATSTVEPQGSSNSSFPALRSRFVAYGSRATPTSDGQRQNLSDADEDFKEPGQVANKWPLSKLLDSIASIRVPHRWFIHFYLASMLSSAFWGYQILTRGFFWRVVCENPTVTIPRRTMSVDQVIWAWSLMSVQGIRRFLESLADAKASASKMFLAHWLLGLTFYVVMGIAIWIDGAG
ncbi:Steroid 5 alpha-reductase 3 [Lobaria immixta]|nr:Steroid 5 alpha-reductase 3 [Lobaria immixta]